MDDASLVRGLERLGDLPRDVERFADLHRTALRPLGDELGEGLPFDQLHHDGSCVPGLTLDAVDLRDMRMVERRERFRLPLESRQPIGIAGLGSREGS